MKRSIALMMSLAVLVAVTAPAAAETLRLDGSTTVGPIADAFAEAIQKEDPSVTITVSKTGSGDGAAALQDERCDIANMSRFMKEKEFKACVEKGVYPVAHVCAMDGVCIIVHPTNAVSALSTEQVRDIYMGKTTNWSSLGGPNQSIVFISRDTNSGTYETFNKLVMNKEKIAANAEYVNSNPQMHARVSSTPNAVGYVGLGFVDDKIKALKIDGVMPSKKTIASGKYPVSRPLYMFTNGYPTLGSLKHKFVTYHLSEKGQEIVEDTGFVPVTDY